MRFFIMFFDFTPRFAPNPEQSGCTLYRSGFTIVRQKKYDRKYPGQEARIPIYAKTAPSKNMNPMPITLSHKEFP